MSIKREKGAKKGREKSFPPPGKVAKEFRGAP